MAEQSERKPLPKEVFIYRDGEGEDQCLSATEEAGEHAELYEDRVVGRYQLVEELLVSGKPTVKKL